MSIIPDPRHLLSLPALYTFFQRMVRGKGESTYVNRHIRPQPGDRILDLGCGTGDILRHMPAVDYLGIDSDSKLVEFAKKIYGDRGVFRYLDVSQLEFLETGTFDIVLATGVLHHLTDDEAIGLFHLARKLLKDHRRLVTLDGCYVEGQSYLARLVLSRDRGRYVRTQPQYVELAGQVFTDVEAAVYDNLVRIPSSVIILECRNS